MIKKGTKNIEKGTKSIHKVTNMIYDICNFFFYHICNFAVRSLDLFAAQKSVNKYGSILYPKFDYLRCVHSQPDDEQNCGRNM
jgi:hypothetical protein